MRLLAALLILTCAASEAHAATGNELAMWCREDGNGTFHSGLCSGYISGVIEWQATLKASGMHSLEGFCFPDRVTNGQTVDVVKKYLKDNPDKTHWGASALTFNALVGAFPCANSTPLEPAQTKPRAKKP